MEQQTKLPLGLLELHEGHLIPGCSTSESQQQKEAISTDAAADQPWPLCHLGGEPADGGSLFLSITLPF